MFEVWFFDSVKQGTGSFVSWGLYNSFGIDVGWIYLVLGGVRFDL